VPLRQTIYCAACGAALHRKPQGRCPACGADIRRQVEQARTREARIERVVAVIGTALVLLASTMTTGLGLVEGALVYAGAGVMMFYVAKHTFR
jgi:predicted amidophosphoribosyltransferase